MKVLITGATGFVGAAMVRHFAALPDVEVIALGRTSSPPRALTQMATYVQADLLKPLPDLSCDVCIHTAAIADDKTCEEVLYQTNVEGTRHLARAVKGCRVFVHISSSSVYDNRKTRHLEDDDVAESDLFAYGLTKRKSEDALRDFQHLPSVYVLRPRAIYGIGDRVLLPRLLQRVRFGRIIVPGTLEAETSLTNVQNLAIAAELSARQALSGFHVFNIADEPIYRYCDVFSTIIGTIHGRDVPFLHLPLQPVKGLVRAIEALGLRSEITLQSLAAITNPNILDIARARQQLGYHPSITLSNSLADIKAWAHRVGVASILNADADLPWR